MHALPGLHIYLLGGFRLINEGKLVTTFTQARLQALLAYLLLHRHSPQPRQHLSYLFWPDSPEAQARTNLRQLLHHLQRALPASDQYLQIEKHTLQWKVDATYTLDVAGFEQDTIMAAQARQEGQYVEERRKLESAVGRYQGELLPACYDDWILPERERLRQIYCTALEDLIDNLEDQHDYRAAIVYAEALLRHDPLREITYQQLMWLHALNGDRASALRMYHTCATILGQELGVKPSSQTQEVYQNLLNVRAPTSLEHEQKVFSSVQPTLIGRDLEWSMLQTAWRHAADGHSGLVIISGEAGIGKTRLAEEFLEWAGHQGVLVGKTRSYAAEGQLAYAPVTELLRTEPFRHELAKLDSVWLNELVRLMPELLEESQDLVRPEPISGPWQRQHLFEALSKAVETVKEPLLLLFDDLQWCDRDTLEWLHYLLHSRKESKLLIIGVTRSEEVDDAHPLVPLLLDLRNREYLTEIELGPLDSSDTTILAEQVSGRQFNPDGSYRIYLQSEGNPLFVVEIVRAELSENVERGRLQATDATRSYLQLDTALYLRWRSHGNLPAKVYAVIQTRLGQLSPAARELARLAATIGRAFSLELLSLASELDDEALVRGLDQLWRRRIVREQDSLRYDFSHDLIREVAYTETSAARQSLLHRRVAGALEQLYGANLDEVSSQIAAHYERAGLAAQAIDYYQRAAKVAQSTYSNAEVIHEMNSALALLPNLPVGQEKNETELSLLLVLAEAYMLFNGYGHPNAERVLLQAWKLCQALENHPDTVKVLAGLWICYHVRGDMGQEIEWAEKLEREMQRGMDGGFISYVYLALIGTAYFRGDFLAAKHYGESQFNQAQIRKQNLKKVLFGYNAEIPVMAYWASSLWRLGYPAQAATQVHRAVAHAANSNHPVNTLISLSLQLDFHILSREISLALNLARRIIDYSIEKVIPYWLAHAHIIHGWVLVQEGYPDRGIEEQKDGLATLQEIGTGLAKPYYLLLLAESYLASGRFHEGLKAGADGLEIVYAGQEYCYEAELHRCQGKLILAKGGDELEAESCFRQALETARRQHARSYELRAAMNLSRLWQQQGKRTEAYQTLADIYNWFTEGFDTADLQQAQEQLKSLA
jgi:DNA-binding SARP family transcriptional activator/predicted ATPase